MWKSSTGVDRITPVNPPKMNVVRKPRVNSIGVSKVIDPLHMVPIQLKNFTPVGTAISIVMKAKNSSMTVPRVYMWWAHTVTDRAAIAIVAPTRVLYPKIGLAEGRDDLGDDAEERQREHVYLGVTEEPEQVLPQDRAPVLRVEDVRLEAAIRAQGQQSGGQRREGHQHQHARDQGVPGEDRHAEHRHPRHAHGDDRGDDVDRAQDRPEALQGQTEHP